MQEHTSIDLQNFTQLYRANPFFDDYSAKSFKIREDYLPLIKGVLIPYYQILDVERELFSQIDKDYMGENPLFIPILKGAVRFAQDMFTFAQIVDPEYEFMSASSYGQKLESGELKIDNRLLSRLLEKLRDQHRPIILVEDIVDTGHTLSHITSVLQNIDDIIQNNPEFSDFRDGCSYAPSDVSICTLLNKPSRRNPDNFNLPIKYSCFTIPNVWVLGYGLDIWDDKGRTIDHICVLADEYKEDGRLNAFFDGLEEKRKIKN